LVVLVDELRLSTTGRSDGFIFSAISSQLLKAVTVSGSSGARYCCWPLLPPDDESGYMGSSN
jgi:hypothetical protein